MSKIRVISTPPGFAPEEIREQWVGVEIPLVSSPITEENETARIGNSNQGGYQVKGIDAVDALIKASKFEAAEFWESYSNGNFQFKQEVCELIA